MTREALIAKAEQTLCARAARVPAGAGHSWSQLPEEARTVLINEAATAAVDTILAELGITAPTPTAATASGPHRLQRETTKGWRRPAGAIIVDRSTWWGNPFIVGHHVPGLRRRRRQVFTVHDAAHAVELYTQWLSGEITLPGVPRWARPPSDAQIRRQLGGANLICWCPLTDDHGAVPCHADVLLRIANLTPTS